MIHLISHLLVAYVVLVEPWLGHRLYNRLKAQVAAGVADAKVRFYRTVAWHQLIAIALVVAIWRMGRIPAKTLGFCVPTSWQFLFPFLAGFVLAVGVVMLLLRKRSTRNLQTMVKTVGALLPISKSERSWFAWISVGAGISEEMVFRGFLLYYIAVNLPGLGILLRVALASLVFGLCHFYQGWRGVLGTAILGAIFASLFVATGSLLLPAVLHALFDLRILLIFTPNRLHALEAEAAMQPAQGATL